MKTFLQFLSVLAFASALTAIPSLASAEDRWVADFMYLPMRSGKGNQYRIVANLKSGARLTVISTDEDGEWLEVETRNGTRGYVRGQYLIDQPIAAQRLEVLQQQHDKLQKTYNELRLQLDSTETESGELNEELSSTQNSLETLQAEFDQLQRISEGAVTLNERHNELLHNYELLKTELDVVKATNARLQADSRMTFLLYGAGAVLLGVIITLVVPHLRRRRRFSEWAN